jgi:hypothetical protein
MNFIFLNSYQLKYFLINFLLHFLEFLAIYKLHHPLVVSN